MRYTLFRNDGVPYREVTRNEAILPMRVMIQSGAVIAVGFLYRLSSYTQTNHIRDLGGSDPHPLNNQVFFLLFFLFLRRSETLPKRSLSFQKHFTGKKKAKLQISCFLFALTFFCNELGLKRRFGYIYPYIHTYYRHVWFKVRPARSTRISVHQTSSDRSHLCRHYIDLVVVNGRIDYRKQLEMLCRVLRKFQIKLTQFCKCLRCLQQCCT